MFAHVPQEHLHPLHRLVGVEALLHPLGEGRGPIVADTPGPAVRHQAVVVEEGQVAACGHVAGLQREAGADGGEDTAAEVVAPRVVAEQGQVPGAGADGDARSGWFGQSGDASGGKRVEVGRVGVLELGAPVGLGVAAESIDDEQEDAPAVLQQRCVAVEVDHRPRPYRGRGDAGTSGGPASPLPWIRSAGSAWARGPRSRCRAAAAPRACRLPRACRAPLARWSGWRLRGRPGR